ncbi:MAG: hypothetical protein MPK06_07880 [Alphaproteobacteria bacterium]|nr:hypothetical protein [Alphaproteobacteria bacterium]MDA8004720.1 hypothetical protein [Alphaproteobacteria bacterium]MDA8006430.1 hypothetical protein [Alphaproteobacteria bacterium]MDA8012790.1 hypothetical protein [Alphaproteobacteria bacterium]
MTGEKGTEKGTGKAPPFSSMKTMTTTAPPLLSSLSSRKGTMTMTKKALPLLSLSSLVTETETGKVSPLLSSLLSLLTVTVMVANMNMGTGRRI